MHILSIILFAISASSDNLIVGLSYGAKKVRINFANNFMVSLISGIGTFLAMLFGKALLELIPIKCSNIIGSGILILFGIYLLINWLRKDRVEANILVTVLCINNIGLGIGASITGLNVYITSISSLLFSLVFIPAGFHIGEKALSDKLSSYSEIISICMIIALAIYELFI